MFDIKENLKKLPDEPGVYLHKDKLGQVIYVGKAISLKKRVSQYFRSIDRHSPKVRAMVENIEEFEYIIVASEMEALILECNLIKKYAPKYNILLRDDKSYPYIEITFGEKFPRILKTRRTERKNSKYFGPYSDAGSVNKIVELLMDIYRIKRCNMRTFPQNFRPCLNYYIGKCDGICKGDVDSKEYSERIAEIQDFLSGKTSKLKKKLEESMNLASDSLDFEKAAKIRDQLLALESISETQRASIFGIKDIDIVLGIKTNEKCYAVQFLVRDGKLVQREYFLMDGATDERESVSEFIKQYYAGSVNLPYQILVDEPIVEQDLVAKFLSNIAKRKVEIYVPKRGTKKELMALAKKDSLELKGSIDLREHNKKERTDKLRIELNEIIKMITARQNALLLEGYRVEAYDISNTNGVDSVAGMVVFNGLAADKKSYRRFKIRTIEGPNDYGSMQEVLYRRLRAAQAGEPAFLPLPDLILLDGGKGQVSAGLQALAALKVKIPIVGMAKDEHHRSRALVFKPESAILEEKFPNLKKSESDEFCEIELADNPLLFKYIGVIQEEVHRFSIDYHKKLRGKHVVTSVLDEIKGIGNIRRIALLSHFGNIDAIKNAGLEELAKVPGMNEASAKAVVEFFNKTDIQDRV
ncbi:MAG: excinuclease ABC subunit UvrC [Eubacteriales bacterium]